MSIADLRKEYKLASLNEADVAPNPIQQFGKWFNEALTAELPEPNTMTLATAGVTAEGVIRPSARIVLIKDFDARGFAFFTNYNSRKGQELAANSAASLLFYWIELERQVRIEGEVEKLEPEESEAYFGSRPLLSRIGAWASPQSEVIQDRQWLEERFATMTEKFKDTVPRPPHWGGYRLKPDIVEFWQGRPSRLHDRILYRLQSDGDWKIERLSP
ncbi:MAG TPA: pyridoxamine 5'-phosphate oxidase [Burkholderiales bacterium]|nr:pyridoxamine 5'-phosphate oxidase [Burkholderiales bacterium]